VVNAGHPVAKILMLSHLLRRCTNRTRFRRFAGSMPLLRCLRISLKLKRSYGAPAVGKYDKRPRQSIFTRFINMEKNNDDLE